MNNRKAALEFLVRIAPHLMKQSFSFLYSMNKNILIVFRNTISLSTDALIGLEHINKKNIHYAPFSSFSLILFFCCHIVTLSYLHANILNMLVLRARQQCDNKLRMKICYHTI